jgi:hypothetical protein
MGHVFLGAAMVPVPTVADADGVKIEVPLVPRDKHAANLASLSRAAGSANHALGTLHLHLWRCAAEPGQAVPVPTTRRGLLSHIAGLSPLPRRGGNRSSAAAPPGLAAPRTVRIKPPLAHGAQPSLTSYLHVDVVRARNLLPMDRAPGREASTWTSDPFVTAQLLPAARRTAPAATPAAAKTLSPVWDAELVLPPVARATAVRLVVWDQDKVGADDYMGEVTLPLPPAAAPGETPRDEHLAQGWFPLQSSAEHREELAEALRAVGRHGAADALAALRGAVGAEPAGSAAAGALGDLYVRVWWGSGVPASDVNARPELRPRLGTLRVRVHEARGLPAKFADRPLVTVTCEHQVGVTPAVPHTRDPVFAPETAEFTFAITEITSDIVFTVLDRDPLIGDQIAGEVLVPLPLLLAPTIRATARAMLGPTLGARLAAMRSGNAQAARVVVADDTESDDIVPGAAAQAPAAAAAAQGTPAAVAAAAAEAAASSEDVAEEEEEEEDSWSATAPPRWAEILPVRQPGEPNRRVRPKPKEPLGALCFSAHLQMDCSAVFAYAAPDVMPPEVPHGRDASGDFSMAALTASLGRMMDGIFMPMFAPLRTLLYLQSWQAPQLNVVLLSWLWMGTMHFWFLMRALTPLWLLLWPVLHGYVSYLIHQDDFVPISQEEADEEAKARADEAAALLRQSTLLWEAQAKALAAAREAADPTAAAAKAQEGVGIAGAISSTLGSLFGSGSGDDATHVQSNWAYYKAKLEYAHVCGLYYADMFDTWANLFTWRDRSLSAVVALTFTVMGLAASAALTAVCLVGSALGLGVRHLVLAAGLACFYPNPQATRLFLEACDYYLSYIPFGLTSQVSGAGLVATLPPDRKHLSEAALRERIEAEAAAYAEGAIAKEEAARIARGRVRHVTLTRADWLSGDWLWRLIARSPTAGRDTHMRMAARITAVRRPTRASGDAAAGGATPAGGRRNAATGTSMTPKRTTSGASSVGGTPLLARPSGASEAAALTPMATPRPSGEGSDRDAGSPQSTPASTPASVAATPDAASPPQTPQTPIISGVQA